MNYVRKRKAEETEETHGGGMKRWRKQQLKNMAYKKLCATKSAENRLQYTNLYKMERKS